MKSQYEFVWDQDSFGLALGETIHKAFLDGHRIIWNHKGMRGVVPPAVLEAHYTLLAEYKSRLRAYDAMPQSVGVLIWDCVVLVLPRETPDDPQPDEDSSRQT